MNKDYCLQLSKDQIKDFIKSIDKERQILVKSLKINDTVALEVTCKETKKYTSYLFSDTNAWYSEAPMEYSKKFLTPRWNKYLEDIFGNEYIQSFSKKIKSSKTYKNNRLENEELNSL